MIVIEKKIFVSKSIYTNTLKQWAGKQQQQKECKTQNGMKEMCVVEVRFNSAVRWWVFSEALACPKNTWQDINWNRRHPLQIHLL